MESSSTGEVFDLAMLSQTFEREYCVSNKKDTPLLVLHNNNTHNHNSQHPQQLQLSAFCSTLKQNGYARIRLSSSQSDLLNSLYTYLADELFPAERIEERKYSPYSAEYETGYALCSELGKEFLAVCHNTHITRNTHNTHNITHTYIHVDR